MLTAEQAKTLRAAVRRVVRAEVAASWKGSAYREDVPFIESELRAARATLAGLITRFSKGAK